VIGEHRCTRDVHTVAVDHLATGRLAAHHLAELGHRRIGFFGALFEYAYQTQTLDGFRDGGNDVAVAFAGGYSDINASGRSDDEPAVTVFRQRRKGVSARFAAGRGPVLRPFTAGLTPLVTVIASYDHADLGSSTVVESRTDGGGVELTLMNVFALRAGRFSRTGGPGAVHDATYGWGLALPIGEFGGVAYDEGRWPESDDRDPLHRRQFAVWLDPFAVWRAASGSDEAHAAP